MELSNEISILFVVGIVVLLFVTIFIDNYSKIKKQSKTKELSKDEYQVHSDVKSILNQKDSNKGIQKNEEEYIKNGIKIIDIFSSKINQVIKDIR